MRTTRRSVIGATRDVGEDVRPVAQVALVAGFEESV